MRNISLITNITDSSYELIKYLERKTKKKLNPDYNLQSLLNNIPYFTEYEINILSQAKNMKHLSEISYSLSISKSYEIKENFILYKNIINVLSLIFIASIISLIIFKIYLPMMSTIYF